MNIVKRIDQYDESHVIFCEPIKYCIGRRINYDSIAKYNHSNK